MVTQDKLKELFQYKPDTGQFIRTKKTSNSVSVGEVAGSLHIGGYWEISINNKKYLAHRLAFLYMTGCIPEQVDHINLNKKDNSWENLRASSPKENACNKPIFTKSKTSHRNVYPNGKKGFMVKIRQDGNSQYYGTYPTLNEALKVAGKKRKEVFGELSL